MKKLKIIFAAIIFTGIISCKKEPANEPGGCELKGTFEQVECGNGYYGSYFIRLDDGTLLQPTDSKANNIKREDVYNGMYVSLSYTKTTKDPDHTMIVNCVNTEATKAIITCISSAPRMWCGTK